ncbi:MAG: hypothetical protein JXA14_17540 [Anaerolineae bacterium]|nr:hypothetical protein [Anaerolineae bacterium]
MSDRALVPQRGPGKALALRHGVPRHLGKRMFWIWDSALRNKLHLMAEAGAGKSRLLGRILAWLLFLRHIPQIILDPTGGTIDNFLDKIIRLPREQQEQLWPRVQYVDMSGRGGYVVPFPLYHRLSPEDTLFDVSQRYLEVVRRMDPHLQQAPVLGYNALATIGTYAGMLLAALDCQITEAPALIRHPERWEGRMERALSLSPEVEPAVEFFRDFAEWKADDRSRYANTFLTKILPFSADPKMRAMFGASEPGIAWDRVVAGKQTVLLDFSRELNAERRRFKLLWCFHSLCDFFKLRGMAGRDVPISFIIDELTQLLGFGAEEHSAMASDIEELISVVARNYGVYLTIAHQNLPQIGSERIQKALMTMGTQIIGVQTDPISAQLLAHTFLRYDPYAVKRQEPMWMSNMGAVFVVDYRPIEFTPEEQTLLGSHRFMDLRKFEFLVRAAQSEGEMGQTLRKMSIARLDRGLYPESGWVDQARVLLMERRGRQVDEVNAQIAARQAVRSSHLPPPAQEPKGVPGLWGR